MIRIVKSQFRGSFAYDRVVDKAKLQALEDVSLTVYATECRARWMERAVRERRIGLYFRWRYFIYENWSFRFSVIREEWVSALCE